MSTTESLKQIDALLAALEAVDEEQDRLRDETNKNLSNVRRALLELEELQLATQANGDAAQALSHS